MRKILFVSLSGLLLFILIFVFIHRSSSVVQTQSPDQQVIPTTVSNDNAEIPEDFPLYPSEISDKWSTRSSESSGSSFVLTTQSSPRIVFGYYVQELGTSDWSIQDQDSENYSITFKKGDVEGFLIVSSNEEGETLISITFAEIIQ